MMESIENEVWAFDMEWVPDAAAGRMLYGPPRDRSEQDVLSVMWERGGATVEEPRPFLKTALCRIVSIAAVRRSAKGNGVSLDMLSLPGDVDDPEQANERNVLIRFLDELGCRRPLLVGFNSSASDLNILMQRAVVHGLAGEGLFNADAGYFDHASARSVDLMRVLGGWGRSTPSLHEMATLSGIPGKLGTDGSDVAGLWLDGHHRRIVDYNECDAITTYLLWLRVARFRGTFSADEYEAEQDRVRAMLEMMARTPRGRHAQTYLREWERLAALHRAQHGADLSTDNGSDHHARDEMQGTGEEFLSPVLRTNGH